MTDDSETARLSWSAGPEGLAFYRNGAVVAKVQPDRIPQLMLDLARVMATRGFGQ